MANQVSSLSDQERKEMEEYAAYRREIAMRGAWAAEHKHIAAGCYDEDHTTQQ